MKGNCNSPNNSKEDRQYEDHLQANGNVSVETQLLAVSCKEEEDWEVKDLQAELLLRSMEMLTNLCFIC